MLIRSGSRLSPQRLGCRCRSAGAQVEVPTTPHDEAMARRGALQSDKKGLFRFNPARSRRQSRLQPVHHQAVQHCDLAKGRTTLAFRARQRTVRGVQACPPVREPTVPNQEAIIPMEARYWCISWSARPTATMAADAGCRLLARQGQEARLTSKMSRPQKFVYQNIYHSSWGPSTKQVPRPAHRRQMVRTRGIHIRQSKRAFRNMLTHGLKQSNESSSTVPN
jgi:hypothetical protein